uniref:Protein pleiotropic regulator PRL2 n=1 Tax=Noccaea caerulescens TaxID=107243 RepID=A0A1J3ITN0_NOCCA
MTNLTTEIEPQSLKKLSLKSVKRALDLFSPVRDQFPPADPESKKIRFCHKIEVAFGGVEPLSKPTRRADHNNEKIAPSNALALASETKLALELKEQHWSRRQICSGFLCQVDASDFYEWMGSTYHCLQTHIWRL